MTLQMRLGVLALGSLMVLAPVRAEGPAALSPQQQEELKKLHDQLWEEGYSDEAIEKAVAERKAGMSTAPQAAAPEPAKPQGLEARILEVLDDAVQKGIFDDRFADGLEDKYYRGLGGKSGQDAVRYQETALHTYLAPAVWVAWHYREAKGDVSQLKCSRAKDLLQARKTCREKKLDPAATLEEMRRNFPKFPEGAFELTDDFLKNAAMKPGVGADPASPEAGAGGSAGGSPSGTPGAFSEEEVDEVVDDLMRQEFGDSN